MTDMTDTVLMEVAPAFVEMAHRIVWSSAATVDAKGRPVCASEVTKCVS